MKEKFEKMLKETKERVIVARDWVVKNRFEIMAVSYVVLYLVYEETCKENKKLKKRLNNPHYSLKVEGSDQIPVTRLLTKDEFSLVNSLLNRGFTLDQIVDLMGIRSQG